MPAQKRSHESPYEDEDDVEQQNNNSNVSEDSEEDDAEEEEQVESEDDDESPSSDSSDQDEFIFVKLADIRKEMQCPICLGIIRKTRRVMECQHRFCRECIDKSMRLGNNECPACRAHCASRRSLRDDPNYDNLIAILYPDIDKYEEEDLAFHEEEKARNKQIQESIAQTSRRQLEALGKKRTKAAAAAAAVAGRSHGNTRNLRGRKSRKSAEPQRSDDEDDTDNDIGGKYSSSDDPSTEVRPKRHKRRTRAQSSQPSLASSDNEAEPSRKIVGASAGLVGSSEILAWGRGGLRSHTRHGSLSSSASKSARGSKLPKLIDHLQKRPQHDKLVIHLKLIYLDEKNVPNSQHSFLHCTPSMSIKFVCQYVALENALEADKIELFLVKTHHSEPGLSASSNVLAAEQSDPSTDELQLLEEHQILSDLTATPSQDNLSIAYKKKMKVDEIIQE